MPRPQIPISGGASGDDDHGEDDDALERTIAAMSSSSSIVHPVHFHSWTPSTAKLFRACADCKSRLPLASGIVQCAACGAVAHRNCGMKPSGRLLEPEQFCKINCRTESKEQILKKQHKQDDVGYEWDENEHFALALEGASSGDDVPSTARPKRRLQLRRRKSEEPLEVDEQGIPISRSSSGGSAGRDLLDMSRCSHTSDDFHDQHSMMDHAMILSRGTQSWGVNDQGKEETEDDQPKGLFARRRRSKSSEDGVDASEPIPTVRSSSFGTIWKSKPNPDLRPASFERVWKHDDDENESDKAMTRPSFGAIWRNRPHQGRVANEDVDKSMEGTELPEINPTKQTPSLRAIWKNRSDRKEEEEEEEEIIYEGNLNDTVPTKRSSSFGAIWKHLPNRSSDGEDDTLEDDENEHEHEGELNDTVPTKRSSSFGAIWKNRMNRSSDGEDDTIEDDLEEPTRSFGFLWKRKSSDLDGSGDDIEEEEEEKNPLENKNKGKFGVDDTGDETDEGQTEWGTSRLSLGSLWKSKSGTTADITERDSDITKAEEENDETPQSRMSFGSFWKSAAGEDEGRMNDVQSDLKEENENDGPNMNASAENVESKEFSETTKHPQTSSLLSSIGSMWKQAPGAAGEDKGSTEGTNGKNGEEEGNEGESKVDDNESADGALATTRFLGSFWKSSPDTAPATAVVTDHCGNDGETAANRAQHAESISAGEESKEDGGNYIIPLEDGRAVEEKSTASRLLRSLNSSWKSGNSNSSRRSSEASDSSVDGDVSDDDYSSFSSLATFPFTWKSKAFAINRTTKVVLEPAPEEPTSERAPRPILNWKSAFGLGPDADPSESTNDAEDYSEAFVWTEEGPPKHWAQAENVEMLFGR